MLLGHLGCAMIRFTAHHPYWYTSFSMAICALAVEVPTRAAAYQILGLFFLARVILTWGGMRIQRVEHERRTARYSARYCPSDD